MKRKPLSLLMIPFVYLSTNCTVWTKPFNNSDYDAVEMPLVSNDIKAPLVADLDVSSLNKQLKHYIDKSISTTFTEKVEDIVEHSQNELKTTMLTNYKENLQESKTLYDKQLTILVSGYKSRFESLFRDLTENFTDVIDNLEEWRKTHTQTLAETSRCIQLQGVPKDCTDVKVCNKKSGVYTIYPDNVHGIKAYCNMDVDGGGWVVIQRRSQRQVKFERTWNDYENGFGEVSGEHWLGNKYIHLLTNTGKYELRINMQTKAGQNIYAVYRSFKLGDAASQYQITVNDYSGTAGDSFKRQSSGKFSATDRDNDGESRNMAVEYGPWWFKSGTNTWLHDDQRENIWGKYIGQKTTMMIRRM